MRAGIGLPRRAAIALAVLCTAWLAYNMVAMFVFRQQVFVERGAISAGGELSILIGFILLLLFNLASVLWASWRIRRAPGARRASWGILALGLACLVLMVGDKAMVDEIGREYGSRSGVTSEWVILYALLAIQLLYNIIILRGLRVADQSRFVESRA